MSFCIYEHWRPDKNACFYVGKGQRKRAFYLHRSTDSPHHFRIVKKLKRLGLSVEVRIIEEFEDEAAAFAAEIALIALRRAEGQPLVNRTDGGEGASGMKHTPETCAKFSAAQRARPPRKRGYTLSEEHKAKIAAAGCGRVVTAETREKIASKQKGKYCPHLIGRRLSAEAIERLRNRVFSTEHKQRISAAKKGKTNSPLHRQRIAEAHARNRLKRQIEGALDVHSHP